ncbi:voltage-gated chloride channel family protein [Bacillus sp. B15-48]|uniref:voltage-gated chloride channel family protein n=1 Tax=Bacillus sp. B15-48 TaxID=1548601 RepID=UPI00193FAC57|nr:voltage-gated chloride channel family protein [Bacillus sp. B15-48]MBM4763465.1 voltage-gated chloride channel protein [Bacillus sp. B15-48]
MNIRFSYQSLFNTLCKWVLLGGLVGVIIGSTTALLLNVNDFLGNTRENNSWLIYFLPLAGIVIGFIYMNFGKSNGSDSAKSNNLVIDSVHGNKRMLRRTGLLVYLGTFITILFGGSTGREGAAIQMGGSVAQSVNKWFNVSNLDTKLILMCGISAGFGAAFGTPITGTVFGMEMVALGKLKYKALVPCLVASFIGHYVTEGIWRVEHEKFIVESVPKISALSFTKVIVLAIIFSLVSVLYSQLRHGTERVSENYLKKNHMLRAFIGGAIIVVLTKLIGTEDYNGRGLDMLGQSFKEDVPTYAFLAKLVFTAITMGTGFVGGEAIPLFFIGATLGNTLHDFFHLPMSFLAAIGMIATFSGGANTPIAAFLLAVEMFEGKGIEYFFVASLISYIFSGHHGLWPSQTIYEPKSRLFHIADGETIENVEKKKKGN